jgi:hypothetical protein
MRNLQIQILPTSFWQFKVYLKKIYCKYLPEHNHDQQFLQLKHMCEVWRNVKEMHVGNYTSDHKDFRLSYPGFRIFIFHSHIETVFQYWNTQQFTKQILTKYFTFWHVISHSIHAINSRGPYKRYAVDSSVDLPRRTNYHWRKQLCVQIDQETGIAAPAGLVNNI